MVAADSQIQVAVELEAEQRKVKNIELIFESSDALGSIPHREIFLATGGS